MIGEVFLRLAPDGWGQAKVLGPFSNEPMALAEIRRMPRSLAVRAELLVSLKEIVMEPDGTVRTVSFVPRPDHEEDGEREDHDPASV